MTGLHQITVTCVHPTRPVLSQVQQSGGKSAGLDSWQVSSISDAALSPGCWNRAEPYVCMAGGGAVEAGLSAYLQIFATTLGSREQLAIADTNLCNRIDLFVGTSRSCLMQPSDLAAQMNLSLMCGQRRQRRREGCSCNRVCPFCWHMPLPSNAASQPRCWNEAEPYVCMAGEDAVEAGLSVYLESLQPLKDPGSSCCWLMQPSG